MSAAYRNFRLHHASLSVSDLPAASRFFTEAFGFHIVEQLDTLGSDVARMTGWRHLDCALVQMQAAGPAIRLELIAFRAPDGPPKADALPWRAGAGHIALHVDDFEAALARAQAGGAKLLGDVVTWSGGRAAYLRIPGDAFVELEWTLPVQP